MDVSDVRTKRFARELFANERDLVKFCGYADAGGVHQIVSKKTSREERATHPSIDNYVSIELIGLALERVHSWPSTICNLKYYYEAITAKEPNQLNSEAEFEDDEKVEPFLLSLVDLLKAYDKKIITAQQLIEIMTIKED